MRQGHPGPLMPAVFSFKNYGQSGLPVSEIFPNVAQHVDDMAFLRSCLLQVERPCAGGLRADHQA